MHRQQVAQDLHFVRSVVRQSELGATSPKLYLLWAGIVLLGFPLPDFAPHLALWYWAIAFPVGFLLSGILTTKRVRRLGQRDSRSEQKVLRHWMLMFFAIGLVTLLPLCGVLEWRALGPLVILISALAYLMASLHLDRRLLWPGLMMSVGYGILLMQPTYSWTVVGILVAFGLILSAWAEGRSRVPQAA